MSGKIIERVRARQRVAVANRLEELRQRNAEFVNAAIRRNMEESKRVAEAIARHRAQEPFDAWRRLWTW